MALIDHTELQRSPTANIIAALGRVPGISTLSTGPNVSKPYIRGLGYNRVLTLFDGVRQEGQQWGDEHGVEVDQFLVDRVEVVKGPASLMYGSDALAGVVNLLPAPTAPVGTISGSVLGSYFTNNKQLASSLALDGSGKGVIWGLRASHKQAADYRNAVDGRVFGTKYDENDVSAYLGVNRSWGFSHWRFSMFDSKQEIPDGGRDPLTRRFTRPVNDADTARPIATDAQLASYAIDAVHQRVQHYRAYALNNFLLGSSRLAANVGFQRSVRREFAFPEHPDVAALHLELNTLTYDLKLHLPEWKGWNTTAGANGMWQTNQVDKGVEFILPAYHDFDVGPFVHARRTFGAWEVSGGVRYDARFFRNDALYTRTDAGTGFDVVTGPSSDSSVVKQFDAYTHTFSGVSASAGAAYGLNERFTLKANIARGYRAPNAAEITARGVHPGTGFVQLGDGDLKPEQSLQEDIGLFYNGTHVTGSIELFNNRIDHFIYNEKLASTAGGDPLIAQGGEDFPVFKFRQTTAALYGGEIRLDIHPHPLDQLHFENAVSVVYASNRGGNGALITDSTRYLPFVPPVHGSSELRVDLRKRRGPFASGYVRFGVQWFLEQDRIFSAYGTETRTPGYTLLDAGIGSDIVDKHGHVLFQWSISASNLADVAYQSNMSRLKYMDSDPVNATGRSGIYEMGRNIAFQVIVPFDVKKEKAPPLDE
jgi:iron complex outermembrane receptor protein